MNLVVFFNAMETKENLKVHIKYIDGRTQCICLVEDKKCSRDCPIDVVTRDKYREWKKTMNGRY